MRKITIFIISIFFTNCQINAQSTVNGRLTGVKPDTKIIVNAVSGNRLVPVDTVQMTAEGGFIFTVSPQEPTLYILNVNTVDRGMLHLMVFPKDVISIAVNYDDSIGQLIVTEASGNKDVELYRQFNNILCRYTKTAVELNNAFNSPTATDAQKSEISNRFMDMQISQNVEVRQLLEKNTDVLISAFLVTFFDNDIDTYINLYEEIDKGLRDRYSGNQFVQYVSSKVKTNLGAGRMAPEIAMKDPQGKERKLSSLRGNVVMIDFWASWCRPCRMENPNVVRLYHKYHSKGFEIYSVSLDRSKDDWVRAIEHDGLVWENHVSDLNGWTSSGGASYGITSVPSTVLIDRDGRIIARNLRGDDLARKLKEIFGE